MQAKIIGAVSESDRADVVATPIWKAFLRNGLGLRAPRRIVVLVCSRQFHSRDTNVNPYGTSRSCQDSSICLAPSAVSAVITEIFEAVTRPIC